MTRRWLTILLLAGTGLAGVAVGSVWNDFELVRCREQSATYRDLADSRWEEIRELHKQMEKGQ